MVNFLSNFPLPLPSILQVFQIALIRPSNSNQDFFNLIRLSHIIRASIDEVALLGIIGISRRLHSFAYPKSQLPSLFICGIFLLLIAS